MAARTEGYRLTEGIPLYFLGMGAALSNDAAKSIGTTTIIGAAEGTGATTCTDAARSIGATTSTDAAKENWRKH